MRALATFAAILVVALCSPAADPERVLNPEFTSWKAFEKNTKIEIVTTSIDPTQKKTVTTHWVTLDDVKEETLTLVTTFPRPEMPPRVFPAAIKPPPPAPKAKDPEKKPVPKFIRLDAGDKKENYLLHGVPAGATLVSRGEEVLPSGQKCETDIYRAERQEKNRDWDPTVEVMVWTSKSVPGGVVKTVITRTRKDKDKEVKWTETTEVTRWAPVKRDPLPFPKLPGHADPKQPPPG